MIVAAAAPLVTVPIERLFVGPVNPVGNTKFNVCAGAAPVMVAAIGPLDTVPMEREFAGPVAPVGKVRLSVCAGAAPEIPACDP